MSAFNCGPWRDWVPQGWFPVANPSCQPQFLFLPRDIYRDGFCHSMKEFVRLCWVQNNSLHVRGRGKGEEAFTRGHHSVQLLLKPLTGLHRLSRLRSVCSFPPELCAITILPEDLHRPNQAKASALALKDQTQLQPALHTEALTDQTVGSRPRLYTSLPACVWEPALLSFGQRCSEEHMGGVLEGLRGRRKHVHLPGCRESLATQTVF